MNSLRSLFATPASALLSLLLGALALWIFLGLARWALFDARWEVIYNNAQLFFLGRLPPEMAWRGWGLLAAEALLLGLGMGHLGARLGPAGLALLVLAAVVVGVVLFPHSLALPALLLAGAYALGNLARRWGLALGLTAIGVGVVLLLPIPIQLWSGLMLSVLLAVSSMVLAFPLGLALALAKAGRLPLLRALATGYIELVRGVPLVSVLFLAFVTLPLFLPEGFRPPQVLRAIVGFTLFAAAYLAENVRGGLQAVPQGQREAAYALGLNGFHTAYYIVLPQALRAVIPAIVGQFIALFKDTSLVVLIGLLDLLGMAQAVLANPLYLHREREVYLFLALVYLAVSGTFSYLGRLIERRLGVGSR